jgi:hypothetical protein
MADFRGGLRTREKQSEDKRKEVLGQDACTTDCSVLCG